MESEFQKSTGRRNNSAPAGSSSNPARRAIGDRGAARSATSSDARRVGRSDARSGGRGGVAPLDAALKSFLRTSGIAEHLGPWQVFRAFAEAAGPEFARHARAVKFVRGELLVEVDSAAHLAELQGFMGEGIRARANEILSAADPRSAADIRRVSFRLRR